MDVPSFLPLTPPEEIKVMSPLLIRIDQQLLREILKWALGYLMQDRRNDDEDIFNQQFISLAQKVKEKEKSGKIIPMQPPQMLGGPRKKENKKDEPLSDQDVATLCTGCFVLLRAALRSRIKPSMMKDELTQLHFPEVFVDDFLKIVTKNQTAASEAARINTPQWPTLEDFQWRVDVAISTAALSKSLHPSISVSMKLSDGSIQKCEMESKQFHELRYGVAKVLQHMEETERLPILKLDKSLLAGGVRSSTSK